MEEWKEHYQKLFTENRNEYNIITQDVDRHTQNINTEITEDKVIEAIGSIKNGRAPGHGGIMMEMVKYGGKLLTQHLWW